MPRKESVVYGVNAALAVAAHRPESIRRVFHHQSRRKVLGPLLKATAAARRPYREVGDEDLRKLSGSTHHEGVVVVTDPLPFARLETTLAQAGGRPLLALDQIGNPHNLGAILRSAAWFGAAGVIVERAPRQATLSSAAVRIAQGGAEWVPVVATDHLPEALRAVAEAGYRLVAAEQGGPPLTLGAAPDGPTCLVLGNEAEGLRPRVRATCAEARAIPGTGRLESLNVAVAAGIMLAWAVSG